MIQAISGVQVWPLTLAVALATKRLDFRSDPDDELTTATRLVRKAPLVTRDRRIRRSSVVPLTSLPWRAFIPRAALPGIVFSSTRAGGWSIFSISSDGTNLRDLTPDLHGAFVWAPSISPDGRWIAFVVRQSAGQDGLWKMRLDGSERTLVTTPAEFHTTAWSPDGTEILYDRPATCAEDLYGISPDGTQGRLVVDAGALFAQPVVLWVSWSSQNELAVAGVTCNWGAALYLLDPDGTNVRKLMDEAYAADWSPDGSRLAVSVRDPRDNSFSIWTVNRDGTDFRRVTPATGDSCGHPSWSPDGSRIVYSRYRSGASNLFIVDSDGSNLRQLTFGDGFSELFCHWSRVAQPPDSTAPITTADVIGTIGSSGWHTTPVDVTLTATDEQDGSGVAATEYSLDGISWIAYSEPITISRNGATSLTYRSRDKAGNVEESRTLSVEIDSLAPVTGHGLSGTQGSDGWYRSAVVVTLSANDGAGSGVVGIEYSVDGGAWLAYGGPITVHQDGV